MISNRSQISLPVRSNESFVGMIRSKYFKIVVWFVGIVTILLLLLLVFLILLSLIGFFFASGRIGCSATMLEKAKTK